MTEVTYADMVETARSIARGLIALGVEPGLATQFESR
jgi:hypothetical protein